MPLDTFTSKLPLLVFVWTVVAAGCRCMPPAGMPRLLTSDVREKRSRTLLSQLRRDGGGDAVGGRIQPQSESLFDLLIDGFVREEAPEDVYRLALATANGTHRHADAMGHRSVGQRLACFGL